MSLENNKVVNFTLNAQVIDKLRTSKSIRLDSDGKGLLELLSDTTRIQLTHDKKGETTAAYYNKSSNLYYLGANMPANISVKKIPLSEADKERIKSRSDERKARGVELLDIPSIPPLSQLSESTTKKKKALKKKTTVTIPNNTTTMTAKKVSLHPKDPFNFAPQSALESEFTLKERLMQLLALKAYPISKLAKSLNCTQLEVKQELDGVGVCIENKGQVRSTYCLRPRLYSKIRISDWPLYTKEDKEKVAANAKEAYDLMHSSRDVPERTSLDSDQKSHKAPMATADRDRAIPATKKKNATSNSSNSNSSNNSNHSNSSNSNSIHHHKNESSVSPSLIIPPRRNSSQQQQQQQQQQSPNKGKTKPSTTPLFSYGTATPSPIGAANEPVTPSSNTSKMVSPLAKPKILNNTYNSKAAQIQQEAVQVQPVPPPLRPSSARAAKALPDPQTGLYNHQRLSPSPPKRKHEEVPVRTVKASKRLKPRSSSTTGPGSGGEFPEMASQKEFDHLCHKFISAQTDYLQTKKSFKADFALYIKVLQETEPPAGSQRSYYDFNVEYRDMVNQNYFHKHKNASSLKDAEEVLDECNKKRRRVNDLWRSIEHNVKTHKFLIDEQFRNEKNVERTK